MHPCPDSATPYDLIQDRSPGPQGLGRFGERHAAARDEIDGDGVCDYFIGVPNHDVPAAGSQPTSRTLGGGTDHGAGPASGRPGVVTNGGSAAGRCLA